MLTGSSWMASTALPPLTGPPDDEPDPDAGLVLGTPQAARAGDRTAAAPRRGTARRRVRRLSSMDIGFLRTEKRDDGAQGPPSGRWKVLPWTPYGSGRAEGRRPDWLRRQPVLAIC